MSYKAFEMCQYNKTHKTEWFYTGLVEGYFPGYINYHKLTEDYVDKKSEKQDVSIVYAHICAHENKEVSVSKYNQELCLSFIDKTEILIPETSIEENKCQNSMTVWNVWLIWPLSPDLSVQFYKEIPQKYE